MKILKCTDISHQNDSDDSMLQTNSPAGNSVHQHSVDPPTDNDNDESQDEEK